MWVFSFTSVSVMPVLKHWWLFPILFFTSTVAAHALIRGTYHFGIKMGDKSVKDDYKEAVK
ncbi:MAG: hypothetical protein MZV63_34640 [Marinilabiliales bacterium]|nr:hypothetical protein [Marinilabiliales bacterium]